MATTIGQRLPRQGRASHRAVALAAGAAGLALACGVGLAVFLSQAPPISQAPAIGHDVARAADRGFIEAADPFGDTFQPAGAWVLDPHPGREAQYADLMTYMPRHAPWMDHWRLGALDRGVPQFTGVR